MPMILITARKGNMRATFQHRATEALLAYRRAALLQLLGWTDIEIVNCLAPTTGRAPC